MSLHRKQQFMHGTVGWMLASVCVLVVLDALTFGLLCVLSFIGFLVLLEVFTPVSVKPRWKQRLRGVVVLGVFVFSLFVTWRTLARPSQEVI